MTAPGPKNPMSKDMRAYLKSRYPNKDLDKLWAESTAMRRHGWQKNLKVWLRLKKIPGIEKLGKINSKVILSLFFYLLITPFAILKNMLGLNDFYLKKDKRRKTSIVFNSETNSNFKDQY